MLLSVVGCVGKSIDELGIACTSDADCPRETWCDMRWRDDEVCRSFEQSSPPHIAFDGFSVGGTIVQTISVPPKTVSIHTLRLRNDGGSEADVFVELAAPACVDASSLTRSDGETVGAGELLDADFDVYPAIGCASPATLAITVTASKRVFTFTTMISIAP
jgi:hypothetical protein